MFEKPNNNNQIHLHGVALDVVAHRIHCVVIGFHTRILQSEKRVSEEEYQLEELTIRLTD